MKKIIALLCVCALALSMTACSSEPKEKVYKVGICQLVQHDALDAATKGFQDALVEKLGEGKVEFDLQNASGDAATCATISNQFVSSGVDLIMANATPALQAAVAATTTIPVLGTSVTDYATALDIDNWTGVVGGNVSGASDLPPIDQQAALINELFPAASTVGILFCSAEPNSLYQANVITTYLEKYNYTVKTYTFADTNDIATVTAAACAEVDVLYIPTDNTAASCMETISNVATPAMVPAVVGWEEGLSVSCSVATLAISYYDLGYQTGLMAYEVLANGGDISTMAIQTVPDVTKKYNAANCEYFGITVGEGFVQY